MNRHRFIRMFFTSLVLGCLVLFAANAAFGRTGLFRTASDKKPTVKPSPCATASSTPSPTPSPTPSESTSPSPTPSDEGTPSDNGNSDEGNQSDENDSAEASTDSETSSDDCETPEPDQTPSPQPTQPSGDREAQCQAAAGIAPGAHVQTDTSATGLDHAIQVVMANCIKNPQAPGLLNALRHLVENRDRHLARDAAKAERRAAKAEHHGSHGHGHGHGGS